MTYTDKVDNGSLNPARDRVLIIYKGYAIQIFSTNFSVCSSNRANMLVGLKRIALARSSAIENLIIQIDKSLSCSCGLYNESY